MRKERAAAVAGLEIVHLTGGESSEAHLDIFWHFYQDTGARKWGRPYLTRACFSLLVERMADRMLLILALRDGRAIAGADRKSTRLTPVTNAHLVCRLLL